MTYIVIPPINAFEEEVQATSAHARKLLRASLAALRVNDLTSSESRWLYNELLLVEQKLDTLCKMAPHNEELPLLLNDVIERQATFVRLQPAKRDGTGEKGIVMLC